MSAKFPNDCPSAACCSIESGHSTPKYRKRCCNTDDEPTKGCCDKEEKEIKTCPRCDFEHRREGAACCDESCLKRLAIRECRENCSESCRSQVAQQMKPSAGSRSSLQKEDADSVACSYHINKTRKQYAPSLEALGCICKALLARNLESCCSILPRGYLEAAKRESNVSLSRSPSMRSGQTQTSCAGKSGSDCCSNGNDARAIIPKKRCNSRRDSCSTHERSCSGQGCCSRFEGKRTPAKVSAENNCSNHGYCASSESQKDRYRSKLEQISKGTEPATSVSDVEKGPSTFEHVILSIQGMTCTGCETKLFNTLSSTRSIANLQTSLVLSRAEFDIDISVVSINDVVAQLERMTDFSCEIITNKGQVLDVLIVGDPNAFLNQALPPGVTHMTLVNDKTVRIYYDAKSIGARDLLEQSFNSPLQLAPPHPHPSVAAGKTYLRKVKFMTLLSAILTIPVLILSWAPLPERDILYGSVSLALATAIQVIIAGPFYPSALKSLLFARVIEMDLLIVLSTSTAYIFSVVAFGCLVKGYPLSTGEFFETSTLLVTLIMVGRFVSALARQKAVESVSIRALQPTTALVINDQGEKEIDARLLQYGDILKIVPESRVTTDGTVISGTSEMDESMVTGEARPIEKAVGSSVIAGSVNGSGSLGVRVTRLPGDNTISTIAGMVDEARLSKPKTQEIADRVAGYFVPVVVTLTIITFVTWIAISIVIRNQTTSDAAVQALTFAIAVLIVSCPCAIGLAVPMVIVVAGGVAAERGVICKTAEAIEIARKVSHVVFDKTGTLTQGKLVVSAEEYLKGSKSETDALLLGLVSSIKHPVSIAMAHHLKKQGVRPANLDNIKTVAGKGIEGVVNGITIRAGNSRWLGIEFLPQVQCLYSKGFTVFCVLVDNEVHAIFSLEDSLRPEAISVVSSLISTGITVSIVSGDDDGAVQSIAKALCVPQTNVKSRCSPGDKQKYVQELISDSEDVIIFCGDGTNDAVALAQASVGVHMNQGSDVAQNAANVVLVRPSLTGVLTLIHISRASYIRIVFNFLWAFVYNIFAILLAAGAFVDFRIPPKYAGLGEIVSVLPVIAIALQLKYAK